MIKTTIPRRAVKIQSRRKPAIKNKRYGRLVILKEVEDKVAPSGRLIRMVRCLCDCGNVKDVSLTKIWSNQVHSCGCIATENIVKFSTTHGHKNHLLYGIWRGMKGRCYNPNVSRFEYYGDRGITVCDEWINDFKSFYDWAISNGWKKGRYIDRKNVNLSYCPENCRFVGARLNATNKRLIIATNTTGYRGITFREKWQTWEAGIRCKPNYFYLGTFHSDIEAARAYDAKARELNAGHPLNFPDEQINRDNQ